MRLDNRRPSTSTTFIDSASGEHVLQLAAGEDGVLLFAYHLFDECGTLVAESEGLDAPPFGLTVRSDAGDVLLGVPSRIGGVIHYRLYGSNGTLLTHSDGVRTRIYPHLRIEGVGRSWTQYS